MEKVHNMRTTTTHKDRTFRKSPTTVQVQDNFNCKFKTNFNQVPRTYNKHIMLWSSAAGVFHMALPSFSWPLGSYIIGSSMYLSASYLQHVQIKCNKLQEHPKNRAVKNCQQVELQNQNNCENCCIHRPMSPHVSNCMQVTSNYLQMKTVDIKSKNSEMNITWTDITRHKKIQNRCNCQKPSKPMHSFCKIVGQLLQTELDPLTTVSYTAYACSAELTASVVSWTASALKTCTSSNTVQANEKQLMHSSSNDVQFSSNELQPNSDDWQSTPFDFQLHGSALLAIAGWTSRLRNLFSALRTLTMQLLPNKVIDGSLWLLYSAQRQLWFHSRKLSSFCGFITPISLGKKSIWQPSVKSTSMVNAAQPEFIQVIPWKFASREVPSRRYCSPARLSWFICHHQNQRLWWLLIRSRCAPSWSRWHRNRRCHWCLGYHWWCLRSIGRCSRITRGIPWHSIYRCRRWCHRRYWWWCNRRWGNRWWCHSWCRWKSRWESSGLLSRQWDPL